MTASQIIQFMESLGANINGEIYFLAESYFSKMIADNRVHVIYEDSEPIAVITFSLENNYWPHYAKEIWEYLPHDKFSDTVYVEKLISKKWNGRLRKIFSQKLVEQFPQLVRGVWHKARAEEDDLILTHRRFTYV